MRSANDGRANTTLGTIDDESVSFDESSGSAKQNGAATPTEIVS